MITRMEKYYWQLVSHTGRFLTVQMIWWSAMAGQAKDYTNAN